MSIVCARGVGCSQWLGGQVPYGLFREGHGGRGRGVLIGEWQRASKLALSSDVAERAFGALPIAGQQWVWRSTAMVRLMWVVGLS